ncbi:MAG: beta/alpha barrel domain-containing protein, partial [Planctomycetota bacterium]
MELPRYDTHRTYQWNYDHTPQEVDLPEPDSGSQPSWDFLGMEVDSPLGIAAGPLLNGRWVLYYARLGFDVLTYKTVRSVAHPCHPMPNLQPVASPMLSGRETEVPACASMAGSWAVSFGMPSAEPDVWRADVEHTRKTMDARKVLSVSVVGTMQAGWGIDDLAEDYAKCAEWALDSGADCVEMNFSCPNVSTCDGQLYQAAEDAGKVARCVREAIGDRKLLIKVGHLPGEEGAAALLDAVGGYVDALAMTNSVATRVRDAEGKLMFDGDLRGICGEACRDASLVQVKLFRRLIRERKLGVKVVA